MAQQDRIEISSEMRQWLINGGCFPEELDVEFSATPGQRRRAFIILDRQLDGKVPDVHRRVGFKGFVLRVQDPLSRKIYAAKLCLPEDYTQEKLDVEMTHSERLGIPESPIVTHEMAGWVEGFESQPKKNRWLCFIGQWIDGETLEQFLESHPERVTPEHVFQFLHFLLRAILFLEEADVKHDDLHLGNIMLRRTDQRLRRADPSTAELAVVVVDIGSMKPRDQPTRKEHDDWSSYARCVVRLHNHIHRNRSVASRYPRFLKALKDFSVALADEDHARHFPDNEAYYGFLTKARDALSGGPARSSDSQLPSPFEAISAEHLANDRVLRTLFSRKLPWMNLISDFSPIVVTGPRGCGKSMVFRYLSLRTHLNSEASALEALDELKTFGVYIGCASDLQNDLLWIKRTSGKAKRLASEITTFFTLVLTRELFRTLSNVQRFSGVATRLKLTGPGLHELATFTRAELNLPGKAVLTANIDVGQVLADELDEARLRLARTMLDDGQTTIRAAPTFVRDLSRKAMRLIPGLETYRLVYFLDDYTVHRLGAEVQEILNSIVWQRDSAFCFKVSSEPFGFYPTHLDDARIDSNREFAPIDVGYLMHSGSAEDVSTRREFIEGLLDKRFDAAGYKSNSRALLGESEFKADTQLADFIRLKASSGKAFYYYGLDILSNAWSGDVATILFVVREMCQRASVTRETTTPISHQHQHEALVHVSRSLVERVSHYHPFGTEMRRTLDAFGSLARRLLVDGKEQKDKAQGSRHPQRRYRIEVTLESEGSIYQHLESVPGGQKARNILQEMVRRSLLIDLDESRGKEGPERRTARFQLRASLLPNYGTSFTRKNYLPVRDMREFALLFEEPDAFADRLWQRYGFYPVPTDTSKKAKNEPKECSCRSARSTALSSSGRPLNWSAGPARAAGRLAWRSGSIRTC